MQTNDIFMQMLSYIPTLNNKTLRTIYIQYIAFNKLTNHLCDILYSFTDAYIVVSYVIPDVFVHVAYESD